MLIHIFNLFLLDRNNKNGTVISVSNVIDFNPAKETKFIVHGFFHSGAKVYFQEMKDALLGAGDFNVIIVDWSKGNGLPYTQATANTQIVGADIAILVNKLIASHGASADRIHCIGHSLGAHICGYAGQRIVGLGKITGLDPVKYKNFVNF